MCQAHKKRHQSSALLALWKAKTLVTFGLPTQMASNMGWVSKSLHNHCFVPVGPNGSERPLQRCVPNSYGIISVTKKIVLAPSVYRRKSADSAIGVTWSARTRLPIAVPSCHVSTYVTCTCSCIRRAEREDHEGKLGSHFTNFTK